MLKRIKKFLFVNSGTKQMVMKNTFWIAFSTAFIKVARAIIIISVARILGAGEYGIFSYALSLVGIFMIFADLGLTSVLTRELSKDTTDKRSYLSTAFVVKTCFLLVSVGLSAIVGPIISKFPEAKPLIIMIAIFVATESFRTFLYAIVRAENKMQREAAFGIISEIFSIALIYFWFFRNPSAKALADAYIVGNALGLIATLWFLRRHLSGLFGRFRSEFVRPIINASWPLAIMGVFGVFMTNIDSVMISFWNGPAVLGLYSAAQKPISLMYVLPSFLSASLLPMMSKMIHDSRERMPAFIEKSYRASMVLAFPIVMGGIMLAGPLVSVTFGPEYAGATLTFQLLLLTLLPTFPGSIFADVLLAEDRQKVFMKSSALGAVTNVILNFILIPRFGIAGSAVATVVAQLVMHGILYANVRKNYKINLFKGLGKILIASILMLTVAYVLKTLFIPLLVLVPTCAIVYAIALYFMKEKTILDIQESIRSV